MIIMLRGLATRHDLLEPILTMSDQLLDLGSRFGRPPHGPF